MLKIRVKNSKYVFIVVLLLLLQVKMFYLLPFQAFYSINSNQQQILMVAIIFISIVLDKFRVMYWGRASFGRAIVYFLIYYIIELFISALKNGQGLIDAFIASNFYLVILMYFVLIRYFKNVELDNFWNLVVCISAMNIMVCWLQYLLSFKNIVFSHMNMGTRFGTTRIADMGETLTCFGIIICVALFVHSEDRKKRIGYFVVAFGGILGNLLVNKGRMTLVALFVAVCAMCIAKYKKNLAKVLFVIALVIIAVIIFLQTPIGKVYMNSFNLVETDTVSVRNREMAYYNEQTTANLGNFLIGVGFIRDDAAEKTLYLRGPARAYSRTDIGIWGLANGLGIVGVIWYLVVTLMIIKKVVVIARGKNQGNYLITLGLLVFSIMYIPTMIMMNPFSITTFTILLAIVDRQYLELSNRVSFKENVL